MASAGCDIWLKPLPVSLLHRGGRCPRRSSTVLGGLNFGECVCGNGLTRAVDVVGVSMDLPGAADTPLGRQKQGAVGGRQTGDRVDPLFGRLLERLATSWTSWRNVPGRPGINWA